MSSSSPPSSRSSRSSRTSSDVTALVAELARVIKGRRFYGPGSGQLARLFERALRSWQADLERHGDLEIEVAAEGLRVPGLSEPALAGEFSTLRSMLVQRGFRSLRVEATLDAEGFAALLEVLVRDAASLEREGGVAAALYARAPVGFVVNGEAPSFGAPTSEPPTEEPPAEPVPEEAPVAADVAADVAAHEATEPAAGDAERTHPDLDPLAELAAGGPARDADATQPDLAPAVEPVASPARPDPAPQPAADPDGDRPALAAPRADGPAPDDDADLTALAPPRPHPDPRGENAHDEDADLAVFAGPRFEEPVDPDEETLPGAPAPTPVAPDAEPPPSGAEPEDPDTAVALDAEPPIPPSLLGEEHPDFAGERLPDPAPTPVLQARADAPLAPLRPPTPATPPAAATPPEPAPTLPPLAEAQPLDAPAGGPLAAAFDEETAPDLAGRAAEPDAAPAPADEPELPDASHFAEPTATPAPQETAAGASPGSLDFGRESLDLDLAASGVGDFPASDDDFEVLDEHVGPGSDDADLESDPERPPASGPEPSVEGFVAEVLRDLDDCGDATTYRELADRAAGAAEKLAGQGLENDAYVVLRALFVHSGDERKRSPEQREFAGEQLRRLASGALMPTLLENACDGGEGSLEANQVLVGLGGDVAVPVFRALTRERSAERRERLSGILIAMGEDALPDLLRLMRADDPIEARNAVRLAGELQSPAAVPRLAELLNGPNQALSQEVTKALARIGDGTAIRALSRALESPVDHVPALAAFALGASNSGHAVEALLAALQRAVDQGETDFAREVIRALGRLGRAEATKDLAAILLRRGLRQRRRHRDLKLAAAAALGRLPGDEAVGALAQAAQSRDAHIRRAAQIALDRRASALASH